MHFTKSKKLIIAILLGAVLALFFVFRIQIKEFTQDFFRPDLPEPKSLEEMQIATEKSQTEPVLKGMKETSNAVPEEISLPASINLDIPFASQAPFANWDLPYQEACEEAAIIMAHYYLAGLALDPQTMDNEILKLIEWQNKTFGYYKDTTAEEMARMLREYFKHTDIEVVENPTVEDVKKAVAAGYPVVLPAAGRLLPNPNFRQPGPIYHALTVKGYTKDKIITNDPGTRRGKNFLYDPDALMNAIHDWDAENILDGKKVMIVVKH